MVIKVPEELFRDFEYISGRNFSSKDNQHVQTIAYIFGEEEKLSNEIVGNGLLYPDQDGHPYNVISKGKTFFVPLKLWEHNKPMLVYSTPDS